MMNQRERALYEAALNLGMKDADAAFYAAEAYGREMEIRYAGVSGGERDMWAVDYQKFLKLNGLHPTHYDLMKKYGARMDDFKRATNSAE